MQKNPFTVFIKAAFLSVVLLAFNSNCVANDNQIAKISRIYGRASVTRPGAEKPRILNVGDPVFIGDETSSALHSFVQITFADGSFFNMFSNSEVRINQYMFDIQKNRRTTQISLGKGRVRLVMFKAASADSFLSVKTKNAIVTANATADFSIAYSENRTEVAALSDWVKLSNASPLVVGEVWLSKNTISIVLDKQIPSPPEILPREARSRLMREDRPDEPIAGPH